MSDVSEISDEPIVLNKVDPQLTPVMISLHDNFVTSLEIKQLLEFGLKIIGLKIYNCTRCERIKLFSTINKAVHSYCTKYNCLTWPLALSVEIADSTTRTGLLSRDTTDVPVYLEENTKVEITSNRKFWNKCNHKKIFVDDPLTIQKMKVGSELSIEFGKIVLVVTHVIDKQNLRCTVIVGGFLGNHQSVCVRGIVREKHSSFSKKDIDDIEFVKEFQVDVVTVKLVRIPQVLKKIRQLLGHKRVPLILSQICEQQGLDNIDEILKYSDGIILAREFLYNELENKNQLTAIQLHIGAKCKQAGKLFYVSGNIMESLMNDNCLELADLSDVTNLVMQGAGLVLQYSSDAKYTANTMTLIQSICSTVEPINVYEKNDFWIYSDKIKPPANAAEACIIACAAALMCSESPVVILPTVTGSTAIKLTHLLPKALIITISSSPNIARKLLLYRGIHPLVYSNKIPDSWQQDIQARIDLAVQYCVDHDILGYGSTYVTLRKSGHLSAYCDHLSISAVGIHRTKNIACDKYTVKF